MKQLIPIIILPLCLTACQSGPDRSPGSAGGALTPNSVQGAQTIGNDQGSAQASENITATNTVTPSVYNILGAKNVRIQRSPDGSETIDVTGSEGDVAVGAANMGVRFGDEGQEASASTGGGAAGGVGGAVRERTSPGGETP